MGIGKLDLGLKSFVIVSVCLFQPKIGNIFLSLPSYITFFPTKMHFKNQRHKPDGKYVNTIKIDRQNDRINFKKRAFYGQEGLRIGFRLNKFLARSENEMVLRAIAAL